MLTPVATSEYVRDVKALAKKHMDIGALTEVTDLIVQDTQKSKALLKQRHNAHALQSKNLKNVYECHVNNRPDWLLVWERGDGEAIFLRTGTHKQIYGK